MAGGKARSTRKLRAWMVEQVNSGKYPGVVWDDESKTMFRIPWKHAGKQDFRKDEDAALFKAWAEFKGKLIGEELNNPAAWKTRLRCALNKSPEFCEVIERAQLDISEPYKVYRLVPEGEQRVGSCPEKKSREKSVRRPKRSSSDSDSEPAAKIIKAEIESPQSTQQEAEFFLPSEIPVLSEETVTNHVPSPTEEMDEITLDVRIEETVPSPQTDLDSFHVVVQYLGHEVVRQTVSGSDVRIRYLPSPHCPPCDILNFPQVTLPEPRSSPAQGEPELKTLEQLLPFMDKGILLTISPLGVYGKRFCQGRVFWTGPHTVPGLHKMERKEPVLLFNKDIFKQQLDLFCANVGERPQCSFTLCFGELLDQSEDPSKKLIIVQVGLPWAEQQVENVETVARSINYFQALADQSPLKEVTLDLELVPHDQH